jgi:hypothetical protein
MPMKLDAIARWRHGGKLAASWTWQQVLDEAKDS